MQMETYYKAINWNAIEDVIDKSTWEKLTEQFWLDTRIPLSNDLDDWRKLSNKEKDLVGKVFGGLTLLDTMQSETGVQALRADIRTPHEEAVFNNIQFMESVILFYLFYFEYQVRNRRDFRMDQHQSFPSKEGRNHQRNLSQWDSP